MKTIKTKEQEIKLIIKMYKRGFIWDYEAIERIEKILEA